LSYRSIRLTLTRDIMKKFRLISQRILLPVIAVWLLTFTGCGSTKPQPEVSQDSPNVVLLIIDALRADKLGCYGFPEEMKISPEIDAMAQEGVRFEHVYSQCSWTRPSIGSMLTSLYPRTIGIYKEKYDILQDRFLTLAEVMKQNGYRTFGITANPNINKLFNFQQGFDEYQDSNVVWKWMKSDSDKKIVGDEEHLPRSREIFNEIIKKAGEYVKKDKKNARRRPAFVQINIMEVHSPHLIREEYKGMFQDYPVKQINFKYSQKKLENLVRGTLAAVKQASSDVGDFVRRLRDVPGWENTLFIITSDHGQGLDDHPHVHGSPAHGSLLYESQLRVPLIFYHPGKPRTPLKARKIKNRVRLLDLMPTILDYVGVSLPKKYKIHGTSLMGLIQDGNSPAPQLPDYFIAETNWRKVNKISVFGKEWKYFENRDGWLSLNKRELHPFGITEDGKLTDKLSENTDIGKRFKHILHKWEKRFKPAKPAYPEGKLSKEEIKQLKSLGYLN
jgi:arylsulfatase A-like enzyme